MSVPPKIASGTLKWVLLIFGSVQLVSLTEIMVNTFFSVHSNTAFTCKYVRFGINEYDYALGRFHKTAIAFPSIII